MAFVLGNLAAKNEEWRRCYYDVINKNNNNNTKKNNNNNNNSCLKGIVKCLNHYTKKLMEGRFENKKDQYFEGKYSEKKKVKSSFDKKDQMRNSIEQKSKETNSKNKDSKNINSENHGIRDQNSENSHFETESSPRDIDPEKMALKNEEVLVKLLRFIANLSQSDLMGGLLVGSDEIVVRLLQLMGRWWYFW